MVRWRHGLAILAAVGLTATVVVSTALPASADTASISGTVTDASAVPLPLAEIGVYATDLSGQIVTSRFATDADGHYMITGISAGTYRLLFRDDGHASPLYSSLLTDVSTPITLNVGDAVVVPNVTLVITSISGTLTDASNPSHKLAGIGVQAVSTSGVPQNGGSADTDSNGHYTIGGLQADTYKLVFQSQVSCQFCHAYLTEWWNNQPDFDSAAGIPIALGQSLSDFDAALTPTPDTTSPFVSVVAPLDGAQYTLGQAAPDLVYSYSCVDSVPGGVTGAVDPGGGIVCRIGQWCAVRQRCPDRHLDGGDIHVHRGRTRRRWQYGGRERQLHSACR